MQTRCPHCSTTFSITHQHLEVADGQVRCGSCDQVFNGRDNVVDAQGNLIKKTKEEKTSEFETGDDIFGLLGEASEEDIEDILDSLNKTSNKDKTDESWADALLAQEGTDLKSEPSAPPPVIETSISKKSKTIVSEPVQAPNKPVTSSKKTATKPADPQQKQKRKTSHKPKADSAKLSEEFLNISSDSKNNPFKDSDHTDQHPKAVFSKQTKSSSSKSEKDWTDDASNEDGFDDQDLMDELSELDQIRLDRPPTKIKKVSGTSSSDNSNFDESDNLEELEKLINQKESELEQEKSFTAEIEKDDKSAIINELEEIAEELDSNNIQAPATETPKRTIKEGSNNSEELKSTTTKKTEDPAKEKQPLFHLKFNSDELDEIKAPSPPQKNRKVFVLETVLISLFTLLLAFQFTYFNMDQFARDPRYRPYYEMACEKLSCKVPTLQNLSKIRGSHLVVREHPDFKKALLIDVILTNHANYPQLFPIMELIFTDSEYKPVKQRLFKPSEYLLGELAKLETMPPNVPIHISLELVDPGPKARGWEINFLSHLN